MKALGRQALTLHAYQPEVWAVCRRWDVKLRCLYTGRRVVNFIGALLELRQRGRFGQRHTAIATDAGAGDVIGVVGGQKGVQIANVARLADPLQGCLLGDDVDVLWGA